MLTKDNDVDIFIDGNKKFRALMKICGMRAFIHIQYYIIKNAYYSIQIEIFLIEERRHRVWRSGSVRCHGLSFRAAQLRNG